MKKIIFALAAVAALVSCSNDEVIEINRKAISFGDTFVDNATRADYSSGKVVNSFKVYGTVTGNTNTVQIFNGANVTNPTTDDSSTYGSAWSCSVVQYWVPSATYNFAAIVDGTANTTTTLPATIPFTVADGEANKDLLYATANVTTNADLSFEEGSDVNESGIVAFDFEHLLSKLQFTIANGTANASGYSYQVTGIAVTGVAEAGTYTVAGETWAKDGDTTTTLTFGTTTAIAGGANAVASETRQILPVEQDLTITITYNTIIGDKTIAVGQTKTGTIVDQAFAANTVYNVTATLTANEIDFTIGTVGGWTEGGNINR